MTSPSPGSRGSNATTHRSLQDIFRPCFAAGFVIDGLREACYRTDPSAPRC